MPRKKNQLGRFFCFLTLSYALLIIVPWPGLERGYAWAFRGFGHLLFARFPLSSDGGVRFLSFDDDHQLQVHAEAKTLRATGVKDTLLELSSRRAPGNLGYLRTSSRYIGYMPTATFLALLVAVPIARRKKLHALGWGLACIHVFIALRLGVILLRAFSGAKAYALFDPSPFWSGVLRRANEIVADDPTFSLVIPTLIWFAVALRHSDIWPRAPKDATSTITQGSSQH